MTRTARSPMVVALVLLLTIGAGVGLAAPYRIAAVTVPHGPALTGDLSDPLWQRAAHLPAFVAADGLSKPHAPTEAYLLADAEALYVGFVCHEPQAGQLVANAAERDSSVWTDDCVEFLLDPSNGDTSMFHWIVNSRGTLWDGFHGLAGADAEYTSHATAKAAVGADRWTCELRLPWADVAGTPQPGEVWGMNCCRERKLEPEEITSWAPSYGNFTDPSYLGEVAFPPAPGPVAVQVLSRGAVSSDANERGLNVFSVTASNRGAKAASVRTTVCAGRALLATKQVSVSPGQSQSLQVPYTVPPAGQPVLDFAVLVDGKPVYGSSLTALKPVGKMARTWVTPDPLYQELLTREPPGLRSQGHLMWSHLVLVPQSREAAVRFGVRYVLDEAYGEYGRHKSQIISSSAPTGERAQYMERHGVTVVVEGPTRAPGSPWVLDPASIQNLLQSFEKLLSQPHPLVWAISAGDEMDEIALREGADLMAKPPADFPYLQQADAEVKRDYGGGQWGIPVGQRDPSPYRWIAYRRWCAAKMRERHTRLRELVQRLDPKLLMLGADAQGGRLMPYEWSSQADLFDIFTQQWTPARTRWRAQLGCISKLLSDLTGKDAWPCAHVERYSMDPTPDEVVEELSQIFRNGGSGVHLYMPDTAGGDKLVGDTRVCYFGSPRRYHTIMNILDLSRTMPRLKYPAEGRTAILFNDDTLQADPEQGGRGYCAVVEACYTLLGPVARSWFKFIDCAQVLKLPSLHERFDTIVLPVATYQRPEIVAKLRDFVMQGGTLICGDRTAFQTDVLGNDTAAVRAEIFGVTDGPVHTVNTLTLTVKELGPPLAFSHDVRQLQPNPGSRVTALATFHNGDPAIACNALGKGRAILFAYNPFTFSAVADADWREFFTRFARWTGAPVNLDIWRFQFPRSVIWQEPQQPGFCLTNNHVLWQEETPKYPQNRDLGATYRYSLPPDAMPDEQVQGDAIPCQIGHLTDRRDSIMAKKTKAAWYTPYELPASRWVVSWAKPDPVAVTFDLRQPWRLLQFKLWFRDTLPAVTVEGSADGQQWRLLGRGRGEEAGADVRDLTIALDPKTASRFVRVTFAARQPDQKLTLVETEVWAADK
ncbi:beta-galactosidase trimerization domain-containing protein [bacterium]|nr:beta-galactosidase trimerization domain-containing protein [bacterium]